MRICFLASGGGGNFKFLHFAKELEIINGMLEMGRKYPELSNAILMELTLE